MYGLIFENLRQYIITVYGEDKWAEIRRQARVEQPSFTTHDIYPDNIVHRIVAKSCKILKMQENEFFEGMGVFFVSFLAQYGYDRVLSVLGRHMRDFINGLDNLHEYLKFSYPKMKAPSFFCEQESDSGLTLHYRSARRGYLWYTIGQIKEVGAHFYNTVVEVDILKEESIFNTQHIIMRLKFQNSAFKSTVGALDLDSMLVGGKLLPIRAYVFLEIFPFCIVFNQQLTITNLGKSLMIVMPTALNKRIPQVFGLARPLIECNWSGIITHMNNVFEMTTLEAVKAHSNVDPEHEGSSPYLDEQDDSAYEDSLLHLKGQMLFMEEWQAMVYLAAPVVRDVITMVRTGLYVNDLSMHDFSRDMVLAGQQQSSELKMAFEQELQKSKQLEDSMKKLDQEMKRTDELLYQMIPKTVADKLRKGESSVDICQFFDKVTILFSDVVTFTEICSRITPIEVVQLLNSMYSLFDQLTDKHGVYKVETIGDAYMIVAGAPEKTTHHAEKICEMALDMVQCIQGLKDPSTGKGIQIRVGAHSGAVCAGVVGQKMPRYCLFGDSVNTASRMESTSEPLKIHISVTTKNLLDPNAWAITERGTVVVKGKGEMKTYWLEGRKDRRPRALEIKMSERSVRPTAHVVHEPPINDTAPAETLMDTVATATGTTVDKREDLPLPIQHIPEMSLVFSKRGLPFQRVNREDVAISGTEEFGVRPELSYRSASEKEKTGTPKENAQSAQSSASTGGTLKKDYARQDLPTSAYDPNAVRTKWSNLPDSLVYAGTVRCEHCLHCHARAVYDRNGLDDQADARVLQPLRLGQKRAKTCVLF
ncbi:soluble guanylate cyclase 88E-like isoform X1 [Varroa destructor]|nr:soluble guanylate cyclase 88E-like isoform X1 [Varroa destructor]XP_022650317.1 soluble guanylate cyclase 88E-like isoform X1 [Varroa destructor]XP_022650318.1 soluble guanylate cyclase 88E-like isoform X1 [Varroa destructor]